MHLFAQLCDEVQPLGDQELLAQQLGEVAFIAKEFADQSCSEFGNGTPIIDVAGCEAKGQQLTLIVDDQVQLEAIKPAHRGFATRGSSIKDVVLMDAGVVADSKRGGVDKA